MPAPNRKVEVWDEVVRMSETMSQAEVGEALSVHPYTVSKWCREEDFQWPRKKGGRPRGERVEKPCKQCGATMLLQPSQASFREFCGRDCTNKWQRDRAAETQISLICRCGEEFSAYPSDVERGRAYCSQKCAKAHQGRRQPNPENHVTLVCMNASCSRGGEPFTRPKSLHQEGAKVFCSNLCSASWTRKVEHIGIEDDNVMLQNGYEAFFYGLCKLWKIPIERFEREGNLVSTETITGYAPDFLVVGRYHVEVKGYEDDDDRERYAAWRAEKGPLAVFRVSDLKALLRCTDAQQILKAVEAMAEQPAR